MRIGTFFLVLFAASLLAPIVGAQTPPKTEKKRYDVIDVGGTPSVIDAKEVKALRKQKDVEFKEAVAAWEAEKKAAKKEKKPFKTPKPKKVKITVIKAGFKSEEAAQAHLEAYLAKKKKKEGRSRG